MNHSFLLWLIKRTGCLGCLAWLTALPQPLGAETTVEVTFKDKETGEKVSSRIEFLKPLTRAPRPKNALVAGRQLLVEGTARFAPVPGSYEFMVRRGPEYSEIHSGFEVERNAEDAFEVYIPHKTPMRPSGWYSGDLQSDLSPQWLARWMKADDLDLAVSIARANPSTASSSTASRSDGSNPKPPSSVVGADQTTSLPSLEHVQSGSYRLDEPGRGGLLMHPLTESAKGMAIPIALREADRADWLVELTRPWERDVPIVLATERVDAIQLLSTHIQPESSNPLSPAIRNPDRLRFQGTRGLARLGEFLYWQMLEAGFRLPPSAGSGFDERGLTTLGYNRVYVWLTPGSAATPDQWWSQFRAGHTFVTNGPLLRAKVNGLPPGSLIPNYGQAAIPLDIELELTVRDPVDYLDVIFNGRTIYQAKLEDHARRGQFPEMAIQESGWMLLRVITQHEASYRMATTAPFYFEFSNQGRISKSAVAFFLDWLEDSRSQIDREPALREAYRQSLVAAATFWEERASRATAD